MIYTGVTAYFIRDWRVHQLVLNIPSILVIILGFLIPESPRYYLAKDEKDRAATETLLIAKRNKTILEDIQKENGESEETIQVMGSGSIVDLFKNRILLKHTLVMLVVWFSTAISYYAILYYVPSSVGGTYG